MKISLCMLRHQVSVLRLMHVYLLIYRSGFFQILQQMTILIKECWAQNPKSRLTMLRIKKTLNSIVDRPKKDKLDNCSDCNKC